MPRPNEDNQVPPEVIKAAQEAKSAVDLLMMLSDFKKKPDSSTGGNDVAGQTTGMSPNDMGIPGFEYNDPSLLIHT